MGNCNSNTGTTSFRNGAPVPEDTDTGRGAGIPSKEDPPLGDLEAEKLKFSDMSRATSNFGRSNHIGHGPTAEVYRGTVRGLDVAVKKLTSNSQTERDFLEEVELVKRFKHQNVIRLLAFSAEGGNHALAFEFAPWGSVYDLIHTSGAALSWQQRMKILRGAASGLEYLHSGAGQGIEGLVHKRINSKNVLVFNGCVAKIADYKLHGTEDESIQVGSRLLGGVEPPEVWGGEQTQKSDVFSFGVMVLEVLCGRKSMQEDSSRGKEVFIRDWVDESLRKNPKSFRELFDQRMNIQAVPDRSLQRALKLAVLCVDTQPMKRPGMKIIVRTLEGLEGQ